MFGRTGAAPGAKGSGYPADLRVPPREGGCVRWTGVPPRGEGAGVPWTGVPPGGKVAGVRLAGGPVRGKDVLVAHVGVGLGVVRERDPQEDAKP